MWRVAGHVVQALLSAGAVAWLAYMRLPDDTDDLVLLLSAVAIGWLGLEAVGRSGGSAWKKYRLDKQEKLRKAARSALGEAFAEIIDLDVGEGKRFHPTHIGFNVFVVRWTLRFRFELMRVERLRIRAAPLPSPKIRWTKGKGLIGSCWEKGGPPEIVDTLATWEPHLDCSESDWKKLPEETRFGLTYADFRALRSKYKGGMAMPILGENHAVLGVVAIDLAPESELGVECLIHDDVAQALQKAAGSIRELFRVAG